MTWQEDKYVLKKRLKGGGGHKAMTVNEIKQNQTDICSKTPLVVCR